MFKTVYLLIKLIVVSIIAIPVLIITVITHSFWGKTDNERKYGKQRK